MLPHQSSAFVQEDSLYTTKLGKINEFTDDQWRNKYLDNSFR